MTSKHDEGRGATLSEAPTREAASLLPRPLRGIVPPLITPLLDNDTLDVEGLERLIAHVVGGGVHGLFILGSTGEGPSLSLRLRHESVQRSCRAVAGRIPVLVGITDSAFDESVQAAHEAAECGAAAVVLAPPFYYPIGQPELLEYVEHLVARLPLPVFLYNMPSHTKVAFAPATVRQASRIPGVLGLKDSSGDLDYFREVTALMRDRADFALLMGSEYLLHEALLSGGTGGVTGGANLCPELFVGLYEAVMAGDQDEATRLHERVLELGRRLYKVGKHPSTNLKGLKCALGLLGICSDFMAEPFHRFHAPEREIIRRGLADMGLAGPGERDDEPCAYAHGRRCR